MAKDEQWLVLLESLKKLLNRDHISMAIKAFEQALAIDPGFLPAPTTSASPTGERGRRTSPANRDGCVN